MAAADGLEFDRTSVIAEAIRDTEEYHGVRVHLSATLDTARIRLQIDIGLGDVVTPPAQRAALPTLLEDFSPPWVKVYPPETIVAEKLHAMVKLGVANSRMKDFDEALLAKAVNRTFKRRKTAIPKEAFALGEDFYSDRQKQTEWGAFLRKNGAEAPEDFAVLGGLLRTFLVPLLASASSGTAAPREWRSKRVEEATLRAGAGVAEP